MRVLIVGCGYVGIPLRVELSKRGHEVFGLRRSRGEEREQLLGAVHLEKLVPAVILRVAGIYGRGRGYWLKQFLSGEARLQGCGEKFINMIHRDDLVGVIIASLEHGHAGEVYNAVDD